MGKLIGVKVPPIRRTLALVLLAAGLLSTLNGAHIHVKAHLAQLLIQNAWRKTLNSGGYFKPWYWADTWPVARIRQGQHELYVLSGAHGSALAFGPGHMPGSAHPGSPGTTVVAAHRDTHFRFLADAEYGDVLNLQDINGVWSSFELTASRIVDTRIHPDHWFDPDANEMHLITCYPFDAITSGGPLRYVAVFQKTR